VPITFCLAISAIITGIYLNVPLEAIVKVMADGVMNFSLLAIPFFIIMGEIMNEGGIAQRIVNLANLFVGRLPGGLAMVNVMDSMFFGGISGSAVADVSSLGSIVIPMMKKQGYDDEFAVGLTICSACQGVIIPPSHNMIIYAFAVGTASQLAGGQLLVVSVGKLFLGGYAPGILMGVTMLIIALIIAIKRKYPRERLFPQRRGGRLF
jgi:tripartite ATP-independent transporter DctM subunit